VYVIDIKRKDGKIEKYTKKDIPEVLELFDTLDDSMIASIVVRRIESKK